MTPEAWPSIYFTLSLRPLPPLLPSHFPPLFLYYKSQTHQDTPLLDSLSPPFPPSLFTCRRTSASGRSTTSLPRRADDTCWARRSLRSFVSSRVPRKKGGGRKGGREGGRGGGWREGWGKRKESKGYRDEACWRVRSKIDTRK